jgi:hypothetical protein
MQIIIDFAAFLELSGDDIIHPDAAVTQLEIMASGLRVLGEEDRRIFVQFIGDVAATRQAEGCSEELLNFLRSLPSDLGLTD